MYGDRERMTLQAMNELTGAFKEFQHELINRIAGAMGLIELIEGAESQTQAETFRARAIKELQDAVTMIREI